MCLGFVSSLQRLTTRRRQTTALWRRFLAAWRLLIAALVAPVLELLVGMHLAQQRRLLLLLRVLLAAVRLGLPPLAEHRQQLLAEHRQQLLLAGSLLVDCGARRPIPRQEDLALRKAQARVE